MQYSELTDRQMRAVLRTTSVTYLAMAAQGQPYVVPMRYVLEDADGTPVIRMETSAFSLKAAVLRQDPQVCLAFSLIGGGWVDSVLLMGTAVLGEGAQGCLTLTVRAAALTGRRFYLA